VHHSGKDQAKGARGHSSLRAATDTEIEIVLEEETDISVATVTKQRELEIDGQFAFSLKQVPLGQNKRGKEVTSCIVEVVEAPEKKDKKVKLTDREWGIWREIREVFSRDEHTEMVAPERGMPVMRTITRATLRAWLVRRGKFDVTGPVTALSNADRKRLHDWLSSLENKGYLAMNQERIWLLHSPK
jgi:hypothetical protein